MRLRIEHPLILPANLPLGLAIGENQVRILEHLGEEKRLLEIGESAPVASVHVRDGAVPAADARGVEDGLDAGPGPLIRSGTLLAFF